MRFLPWWCCIQRGQQKSTMAGNAGKCRILLCLFYKWKTGGKKKRFKHDCDHKECYFLIVLSPSIMLPSWPELFLKLLVGSHAKEKAGQQNWELVIPFWKAFCLGSGWLCCSSSTDFTLKNTITLKHVSWNFIRRWSFINQALKAMWWGFVYGAFHLAGNGNIGKGPQKLKFDFCCFYQNCWHYLVYWFWPR